MQIVEFRNIEAKGKASVFAWVCKAVKKQGTADNTQGVSFLVDEMF